MLLVRRSDGFSFGVQSCQEARAQCLARASVPRVVSVHFVNTRLTAGRQELRYLSELPDPGPRSVGCQGPGPEYSAPSSPTRADSGRPRELKFSVVVRSGRWPRRCVWLVSESVIGFVRWGLVLGFSGFLVSCTSAPPGNLAGTVAGLSTCPPSPNCVCSDAQQGEHFVEPIRFEGDSAKAWAAVQAAVKAIPRTRIVRLGPDFLRAESRSAIMGFVDDLELQLRAPEKIIAVRSASRVGWSDMGVNRSRVESLRAAMLVAGFGR